MGEYGQRQASHWAKEESIGEARRPDPMKSPPEVDVLQGEQNAVCYPVPPAKDTSHLGLERTAIIQFLADHVHDKAKDDSPV